MSVQKLNTSCAQRPDQETEPSQPWKTTPCSSPNKGYPIGTPSIIDGFTHFCVCINGTSQGCSFLQGSLRLTLTL